MMKINNCTVCGCENIFQSVREKGAFICGGCGARFSAVPEQITVTEDGTPVNDLRIGLLFMADGKRSAAETYLRAAAEAGAELAARVLSLLEEKTASCDKTEPEAQDLCTETEKEAETQAQVPCTKPEAQYPCNEAETSISVKAAAAKKFRTCRHLAYKKGLRFMKNDPQSAGKAFMAAAEMGHSRAAFNMGVICERRGLYGEAMLWYRQAVRDKFAANEANEKLAALYIRFGRPAEAEKLLLEAADGFRAGSFLALGDLYASQGRNELAEEYYKLCIGLPGYEIPAGKRLAALHTEQKAG